MSDFDDDLLDDFFGIVNNVVNEIIYIDNKNSKDIIEKVKGIIEEDE